MPWVMGPWEQRDVGVGEPCWCAPNVASASLDLRSLPLQGDVGAGLFRVPDGWRGGVDFLDLGELDDVMSGRQVSAWRLATGAQVSPNLALRDMVWQTFTGASDPDGQSGPRPVMPDRHGVSLWAGDLVRRERVDIGRPEFAAMLDLYRKQYRVLRERAQAGDMVTASGVDLDYHRRQLGIWGQRLGLASPEDVLIPPDLPKETPLKHRTPLTESFAKADGTGWDADQTWTNVVGVLATTSERASTSASGGLYCGAVATATSGVDHYSQIGHFFSTHSAADYLGPSVRHPSGATNTQYWIRHFNTTNGQTFKYVAGSLTNIGTNTTSASMSSGLVSRLEAEGTSIRRIYNGTTETTTTDSSIDGSTVGGQYAGIRGRRATAALIYEADDWEADVLAGGGGPSVAVLYHHRRMQGMS